MAAIIGDASLGEGMALEALNHIGHLKPSLLVIVNDNKMSIAPPVGGLSRYLNRLITDPLYNRMRRKLEHVVSKLPKGERLVRLGHKVEESLKGLLVPGLLFEELGFRYIGPIDGHSLPELIATLKNIRRLMVRHGSPFMVRPGSPFKGPVLLHVVTVKGKGYAPAERDPERFHKIEPFDLATGQLRIQNPKSKIQNGRASRAPSSQPPATFTEAFSEELIRLAQANDNIIGITAAMPEGTGLAEFSKRFPDRYVDVGMAEQHGLGLAAGLARAGQRPVVALYSTFLQRAYDQIMHELCLQCLPVVLAIDRGGLVGEDGPTHHGVFDLGYLRILPNLVVMSPKDPEELRAMLRFAVETSTAPVAIRYARGGIVCGEALGRPARVTLGKAEVLREGKDVALIALGSLVYPALEAATQLRGQGIDATVVNARFVKPLDQTLLRHLATQVGTLVTLEEGQVAGGFGSAVSEALDAMQLSHVPLLRIGLPDQFVEHAPRAQLLTLCRLDPDSLTQRIAAWYATLRSPAEDLRLLAEPSV